MVLNVDDAIPREALDEIVAIDDINTAFVVSLPNPDSTSIPEQLARQLAGIV